MKREIVHPVTLASLGPTRHRLKVSYQFLIKRLADLTIITPNQYRYLMMQISSRGWRKEEPGDAAVVQEKPLMFSKMVEVVYGDKPDVSKIRRDIGGAPANLIRAILAGFSSGPEPNPGGVISFRKRAS